MQYNFYTFVRTKINRISMKKFFLYICPLLIVLGFVACERDDDEPIRERKVITRLYVSTEDYDGGGASSFYNVWAVDEVDSTDFSEVGSVYTFTSSAKGGSFIHFSPFSGLLFQGSINSSVYLDTAVQVMTVSDVGVLRNVGQVATRRLDNTLGLYYTVVNSGNLSDDFLLTLNSSDTSGANLFAFARPRNSGRYAKPRFTMNLDFIPWGIEVNNADAYITSVGNSAGSTGESKVVVYKDYTSKLIANTPDSVITDITRYDLEVVGAQNLRGISYSANKDLLVLTDYSGAGSGSVGRILLFEEFSKNTASGEITPTRIITSPVLKQPLDVAVDTRATGKYLFVADPVARRVFRFGIDDSGVKEPSATLDLNNRAPRSVSLDARDSSN